MVRRYKYYAVWSDNLHKFGEPERWYPDMDIYFPDIVIKARNKREAKAIIEAINRIIRGLNREDFIVTPLGVVIKKRK